MQMIEREQQEAINEESKQLEKLANKRSLLLNKASASLSFLSLLRPHLANPPLPSPPLPPESLHFLSNFLPSCFPTSLYCAVYLTLATHHYGVLEFPGSQMSGLSDQGCKSVGPQLIWLVFGVCVIVVVKPLTIANFICVSLYMD